MFEMSQILNCGLDQKTLSILASLIENGVNPEALAAVVKELKRETDALKVKFACLFLSRPQTEFERDDLVIINQNVKNHVYLQSKRRLNSLRNLRHLAGPSR